MDDKYRTPGQNPGQQQPGQPGRQTGQPGSGQQKQGKQQGQDKWSR